MSERPVKDLPDNAHHVFDHAERVLRSMDRQKLKLATAESCTGGLIASLVTDIEGLSSTFERGFVTYSEEAKNDLLGVPPSLIARHGVVSEEVARAMADGALERSRADVAIGITGYAGPAGPDDEAGLVHIALVRRGDRAILRECHFGDAGRDEVRNRVAVATFEMLEESVGAMEDDRV